MSGVIHSDFKRTVKPINQLDLLVPVIGCADRALTYIDFSRKAAVVPNQLKLTVLNSPSRIVFRQHILFHSIHYSANIN